MEVKPTEGLKVKVKATKEAVFGEDGVEVKDVPSPADKGAAGVLTGKTLVGFAEVQMQALDGKKHWYPVDQMTTEKGEKVVEEEIPIEEPSGDAEEDGGEEE